MKRLFTACAVLVVLLLTNLSAKTGTADKTAEAQIKYASGWNGVSWEVPPSTLELIMHPLSL